jgi:succinyldiaminopimelate transaminase
VLEPAKTIAARHPDRIVDLSIGTPVDPVAPLIQSALRAAADAPGYPLTAGASSLRTAMRVYVERACAPAADFEVIPSLGSKELVAWLPTLLGFGPGHTVVIPTVCYPTYEVGVLLAGATVVRADTPPEYPADLVWLNSPGNPHGRVLRAVELRDWVTWARTHGAIIVSDECYLALPWEEEPVSVLHPAVNDGDLTSLLALHSLSKRSNLAGYRSGLVAGDPALVRELLAVRKHAGMIMPAPVQAAMVAALGDETHVTEQRARYAARRAALRTALDRAGFRIEHSAAGLYLWCTRGGSGWADVAWFAERGILVAPGAFYGPSGEPYVRVALTATDERIAAAVKRLG